MGELFKETGRFEPAEESGKKLKFGIKPKEYELILDIPDDENRLSSKPVDYTKIYHRFHENNSLTFFGTEPKKKEQLSLTKDHYNSIPTNPEIELLDKKYISKLLTFKELTINNESKQIESVSKSLGEETYKQIKKIVSRPSFSPLQSPAKLPAYSSPLVEHEVAEGDDGYAFLTDPFEREAMLKRMIDMTTGMDERGVNAVVFCDRGARPLATLITELWGSISERPLPPFFFVNTNTKYDYPKLADIPQPKIDQLKEWFTSEYPDGDNPFRSGEGVVCVIDELLVTGKSAGFVEGLVKRAFPGELAEIYCDWADNGGFGQRLSSRPWRDRQDMIGARTVYGEFKSEVFPSATAEQLLADLKRLAATHGSQPITFGAHF